MNKTVAEVRALVARIALESGKPAVDFHAGRSGATAEERERYEASWRAVDLWRQEQPAAADEYDGLIEELMQLDRAQGELLLERNRQLTEQSKRLVDGLFKK